MAAAARGFLEIIPAAVIFRTGYGETEQGEKTRVENASRCTKQTWVKALLSACFFTHSTRWVALTTLGWIRQVVNDRKVFSNDFQIVFYDFITTFWHTLSCMTPFWYLSESKQSTTTEQFRLQFGRKQNVEKQACSQSIPSVTIAVCQNLMNVCRRSKCHI